MRYQEWLCGKWARNWQRKQQCVLMVWNLLGKRRTTVPHYWGWLNPTIQTWLPSHKLDVITVWISWFFRYTFTHLITLLNNAVNLAIDANEPLEQKFIYKHHLEDIVNKDTNESSACYRVFGCPPGALCWLNIPFSISSRNTTQQFLNC